MLLFHKILFGISMCKITVSPLTPTELGLLHQKEMIKGWCKEQNWTSILQRLFPKGGASSYRTSLSDRSYKLYVGNFSVYQGSFYSKPEDMEKEEKERNDKQNYQLEVYPFTYHKNTPSKIYLFDDDRKTIWLKCALIAFGSPLWVIKETIRNLYEGTIGNLTHSLLGLPRIDYSKKDRWWHPYVDLVRTPLYMTAKTIIALAAVLIGPLAPSTLFWFRHVIGQIDRRHYWDQDDRSKNYAYCFHAQEMRKIAKRHMMNHLDFYTESKLRKFTPENVAWNALKNFAEAHIRADKHLDFDDDAVNCNFSKKDPRAPYQSPLLT